MGAIQNKPRAITFYSLISFDVDSRASQKLGPTNLCNECFQIRFGHSRRCARLFEMPEMHLVRSADVNCPFSLVRVYLSRQVVDRGGFLRRIIWVLV